MSEVPGDGDPTLCKRPGGGRPLAIGDFAADAFTKGRRKGNRNARDAAEESVKRLTVASRCQTVVAAELAVNYSLPG